jgi:hypothetical protein
MWYCIYVIAVADTVKMRTATQSRAQVCGTVLRSPSGITATCYAGGDEDNGEKKINNKRKKGLCSIKPTKISNKKVKLCLSAFSAPVTSRRSTLSMVLQPRSSCTLSVVNIHVAAKVLNHVLMIVRVQ